MRDDHQLRRGRSGDSGVQRGPIVTMSKEEKQAFVDNVTVDQLTNPYLQSLYDKCVVSLQPLYDIMRSPTK